MKKNMSSTDRIIRLLVVVLVAVLYFTNVISGTWAIILGVVSVILLLSSLFAVCPLYKLLGISTLKES